MEKTNKKWTIIGGGNGGQAFAGLLAIKGYEVKLFDIFVDKVSEIEKQCGIMLEGAVKGFGALKLVTADIQLALEDTDIIMVVAPAIAHKKIAEDCAPYLCDGQIIILSPGATGGALEFRKVLNDERCLAEVTIAETDTLLFACRSHRPGHVFIYGIKDTLKVAALPAIKTEVVLNELNKPFPQFKAAKNILETSLGNLNIILHPLPTLLNTNRIDNGEEFLYYMDGITPTIAQLLEKLDKERIAIGNALGLILTPATEWLQEKYNIDEKEQLYEVVQNNKSYRDIIGPASLNTRYIWEDIPMGLVPISSLGKVLNIPTPIFDLTIKLGEHLINEKVVTNGRTLENLGILNLNKQQILDLVNYGPTKKVLN